MNAPMESKRASLSPQAQKKLKKVTLKIRKGIVVRCKKGDRKS
jgi:hypothetical protein